MRTLLLWLTLAGYCQADTIVVVYNGEHYLVELTEEMKVPVATVTGGGPTTTNPPVSLNATQASVKALTDAQADPQLKVVLAAIYEAAATKVRSGDLTPEEAIAEIASMSKELVGSKPEWKPWTTGVGELLNDLARRGQFDSQTEVADAFSDVSAGVKASLDGQGLRNKVKFRGVLKLILEVFKNDDGKLDLDLILSLVKRFL